MFFLVLRSYIALIRFDLYLARGNFPGLYDAVRRVPVRTADVQEATAGRICSAVDLACIWYWKPVLCLQRSATTACLLKQHGVPAELVIGAQHMPFCAHAWVEVDGRVVNDNEYTKDMYAVLDRC